MTLKQQLAELYPDEEFLVADGFDAACIGIDQATMRLIYSISGCVDILAATMPRDEAQEYFDFNVSGAYVGSRTPIWCEELTR